MEREKDVDKVLLDQARIMLPYVKMNGHPNCRVDTLEDIPWLVVLVFELLTAEEIPQALKAFRTPAERACTLQTVIDLLEKVLKLPMSHVTGRGVARLDRQHVRDILEILLGLVDHCYPKHQPYKDVSSPEGRRLTLSQLETPPEQNNREFITPPMYKHENDVKNQPDKNLHEIDVPKRDCNHYSQREPINSTHHLNISNEGIPQYIEMAPQPVKSVIQTGPTVIGQVNKSSDKGAVSLDATSASAISMKRVYTTDTHKVYIHKGANARNNNQCSNIYSKDLMMDGISSGRVFDRHIPVMSMFSPKKKPITRHGYGDGIDVFKQPNDCNVLDKHGCRFSPYDTSGLRPFSKRDLGKSEKLADIHVGMATKETNRTPSVVRRPRVKSFQNIKNTTPRDSLAENSSYKPRNHDVTKTHSLKYGSTAMCSNSKPPRKESTTISKSLQSAYMRDVARKPSLAYPNRNYSRASSTGNKLSPITKYSERIRNKRIPSSPLYPSAITSVSKRPPKVRKLSVRSELPKTPISKAGCRRGSKSDRVETCQGASGRSKPSLVSTKVKKHTSGGHKSPVLLKYTRSPVKRGEVSAQTTSLCSSLRLLEEFDYVTRRIEQIQTQKREFEAAIKELEHEEIRLNYIMSHVHHQAGKSMY